MLSERETRGEPLTRAEIGVLLAYAKIVLFSDIIASTVPDEPHFGSDLIEYFPARIYNLPPTPSQQARPAREGA